MACLLLLFGQLLQHGSFFIHHILVFVLIKRQTLGVFVGEEHIGVDLIGKGIFRQIEKGTNGAVAHTAAAPFKIDVHGGLDHAHNGEGLGFQALR